MEWRRRKLHRKVGQNKRRHGIVRHYYENGQLQFEANYEDGNLKSERPFFNDRVHGIWKAYYKNGKVKFEWPYINGVKHGTEKEYEEDGNIKFETEYVQGKKHGIMKRYKKGELIYILNYINDERL